MVKITHKNEVSTNQLPEWYTATQAAERLTQNSGKEISKDYPRDLAARGLVKTQKMSERIMLYWKADIDGYVVTKRGRPAKENKS